jgi:hypothetical protein
LWKNGKPSQNVHKTTKAKKDSDKEQNIIKRIKEVEQRKVGQ